jgi:hypothetical protein
MSEHDIPKGVDFETLREVLVGWYEVGAAEEPTYTAEVEEVTSVADVVGRQTRFLEEIGVLDPRKQKHELTDAGEALTAALADGDEEQARRAANELLGEWKLTEEVRGVVAENPMPEARLVPLVAELAGQDLETSRVETGLTTLLEFYDWADLLDSDDEGRYRLPAPDKPDPEQSTEDGTTDSSTEEASETEESDTAVAGAILDGLDADSSEDLLTAVAAALTEAEQAAEEATAAAEEARTATYAGVEGAATTGQQQHAISLDLDINADDLEDIVRALKNALTEEEG